MSEITKMRLRCRTMGYRRALRDVLKDIEEDSHVQSCSYCGAYATVAQVLETRTFTAKIKARLDKAN